MRVRRNRTRTRRTAECVLTRPASSILSGPSALRRLEQGRNLGLGEFGGDMIEERHVGERNPPAILSRLQIEMLMFDAAGLDRKQEQVSGLPVHPFAVHHRISPTRDHVNDKSALMTMLAGLGLEIVREDAPVLQWGVLVNLRIEVIHEPALP